MPYPLPNFDLKVFTDPETQGSIASKLGSLVVGSCIVVFGVAAKIHDRVVVLLDECEDGFDGIGDAGDLFEEE